MERTSTSSETWEASRGPGVSHRVSHGHWHGGSEAISEPLRRLLSELTRELATISSENATLRRQAHGGKLGAAAYFATTAGPGSSLLLPMPRAEPGDFPDPETSEVPMPSKGTSGLHPTFVSMGESNSERSSRPGATVHFAPPQASMATTRHWQMQFLRLTRGGDLLSAHDLWLVVSSQEHQVYGHNKITLRTVNRTVRQIRQTYSTSTQTSEESPVSNIVNNNVAGFDSNNSGRAPDASPRTPPHQADGSLDWETFLAFMSDDDSGRMTEEDSVRDGEYLRKALRAESNEYMAEQARREIAVRQKEEIDPRPVGWRAWLMEKLPPPIILANAICLGLQSDIQSAAWEVLELFFLTFYLLEISVKAQFLGYRRFFKGSDAWWNNFDLACIVLSLTDLFFKLMQVFMDSEQDASVIAVLKFFRLARLARIIKSFRSHYFDDLKTMSLGLLSGGKVLCWAVILFAACVFVLGVIMKEMVGSKGGWDEFRSVPAAMFSVFRCLTDGCSAYDGTPLHERMRETFGPRFMLPYILVFLIVNFGLFNLIVAVFIDRVVSISVKAKQQELGRREREMRHAIEEMIVSLTPGFTTEQTNATASSTKSRKRFYYSKAKQDTSEENLRVIAESMQELRAEKVQITRELFSTWLTDPDVLQLLENLEIDTATKSEIFDVCDVDKSGSLTCDELVNGLMRLRGPISKCDVIAIRLKVRYLTKVLEDIHHSMGA